MPDAFTYTIEELQYQLRRMHAGVPPVSLNIDDLISGVIHTMAAGGQGRTWRAIMGNMLKAMHDQFGDEKYYQEEVDLFKAVIDILDRKSPTLPSNHRYARAIARIQNGIAAGRSDSIRVPDPYISIVDGSIVRYPPVMQAIDDFVNAADWKASRSIVEAEQGLLFRPEVEVIFEQKIEEAEAAEEKRTVQLLELHLKVLRDCKAYGIAQAFERLETLPFDADLIPRSIKALLGGQQEKMQHAQYLAALSARTTDEQLKTLIHVIQRALDGSDRLQRGQNLAGVYQQALEAIELGVMVVPIANKTLALLGPLCEWREELLQLRNTATAKGAKQLASLLDTVIGLLKAGGNPTGLGAGLTGIYEQVWQELVSHLHHQE